MYGRLFTLVDASDETEIYAWGMEITDKDHTEAIVYRSDPRTRQGMVGLHVSAAAALRRYSRLRPMAVVWEDRFEVSGPSRPGGRDEAADPARPRP